MVDVESSCHHSYGCCNEAFCDTGVRVMANQIHMSVFNILIFCGLPSQEKSFLWKKKIVVIGWLGNQQHTMGEIQEHRLASRYSVCVWFDISVTEKSSV